MTIWWEKTVEYKFLLDHIGKKQIRPLSGNEETALGDAIFNSGSGFLIIEFKRSEKEIKDEDDKYINVPAGKDFRYVMKRKIRICRILRSYGHQFPHYIVYGGNNDNAGSKICEISLLCSEYWRDNHIPIENLMEKTGFRDANEFLNYVSLLTSLKKKNLDTEKEGDQGRSELLFRIGEKFYIAPLHEVIVLLRNYLALRKTRAENPEEPTPAHSDPSVI